MAERLADIVTQIQNVRQLAAVVTAMRGIRGLASAEESIAARWYRSLC